MPVAGDEELRTVAQNPLFLNYQATGANYNWNFNSLRYQSQQTDSFLSVSSTNFLYAIFFSNLPFNPNRANVATEGTPFPANPILTITDPYNFYYRSSTAYEQVGLGATIAGIPLPVAFAQKDKIYQFPLQYGDVDTSVSAWTAGIPGIAFYGYNQTRINQVDGWGQLVTPYASYNVLRVKTTLIGSDTVYVDSLGIGLSIDRPLTREYKWLANGEIVPVLQVNTTELFGLEIITAVLFRDVQHQIQPGTIPLEMCAGSDYLIPYSELGTFNPSSFLIPGNRFTAQLSDALGSFSNPVNIGDTVYHQSGAFTVTIPPGTVPGNGYRIRIISSNPAVNGSDNGADISIIDSPPAAPAITSAGATSICSGDSVLLSETGGAGGQFQWQLNGQPVNGASTNSWYASQAGNYNLLSTNACGSTPSNTLTVSLIPAPLPSVVSSSGLSFCNGDSLLLSGTDPGNVQFQWLLNGSPVQGANGSSLFALQAGQYQLNTINACGNNSSNPITLNVELPPSASLVHVGSLSFCNGDSIQLVGSDPGNAQFQWLLNGNPISGATDSTLYILQGGLYELSTFNSCGSALSNAVNMTVDSAAQASLVSASGNIVFCDGDSVILTGSSVSNAQYQWLLNGVVLNGATDPVLSVIQSGLYELQTSNNCGSSLSNALQVTVNPIPASPLITLSNDTLFTDPGYSYAWYLNGNLISGAGDPYLVFSANGDYTVVVTNANGCTNTSVVYTVTNTGLQESAQINAGFVYPNPGSGLFMYESGLSGIAAIRLFSTDGRLVWVNEVFHSGRTVVDTGNQLEEGIYLLQVILNGQTETHRLIISR
jgi:hypothetical protein